VSKGPHLLKLSNVLDVLYYTISNAVSKCSLVILHTYYSLDLNSSQLDTVKKATIGSVPGNTRGARTIITWGLDIPPWVLWCHPYDIGRYLRKFLHVSSKVLCSHLLYHFSLSAVPGPHELSEFRQECPKSYFC
jgi:hypothetical protein